MDHGRITLPIEIARIGPDPDAPWTVTTRDVFADQERQYTAPRPPAHSQWGAGRGERKSG